MTGHFGSGISDQNPVSSIAVSIGFGICTSSLRDLLDYFHLHRDEIALTGEIPEHLAADCYVCQSRQLLAIQSHGGEVNWRETLRCPGCGLINRWRSSAHVFEAICKPRKSAAIYITEAVTPLYQLIKQRYPKTVGSEFMLGQKSGSVFKKHRKKILIEDVTALSFKAKAFDTILSFDVLEHVPNYRKALAEFFRVLKPGGMLILSAPFTFAEQTEARASIMPDGSIEHHLPAEYHGDPFSNEGVLCFQSFGMDLIGLLEAEGFIDPGVLGFTDREAGYLGKNILFVARKPDTRRPLRQVLESGFPFRNRQKGA